MLSGVAVSLLRNANTLADARSGVAAAHDVLLAIEAARMSVGPALHMTSANLRPDYGYSDVLARLNDALRGARLLHQRNKDALDALLLEQEECDEQEEGDATRKRPRS